MKKLLVLMLVLGITSLVSATVIDVVTVGVGSSGNAGTVSDPLETGETLMLKIVINHNPYPGWSSYDGYALSSMDLSLTATGSTTLSDGVSGKTTSLLSDAGLSPFVYTGDGTSYSKISGVAVTPIKGAADLVWNIVLTAAHEADGIIDIDLGLNGTSQYADYTDSTGANPYPGGWLNAVEGDLGDLQVYVPEPMTLGLLGLGGLFLRRRK